MAEDVIFSGEGGYASLTAARAGGRGGAVLRIGNPHSKVNTVPPEALAEIGRALDAVEADERLGFVVFCGGEGRVHAGADVTMFSGGLAPGEAPPDFAAIEEYLRQGTALDLRIKRLSRGRTTVSAMGGERFGGSAEWPLMCAYCVAAAGTGIQFSEVNIGIIPGWDGVLNVMLRSGEANALYMAATGARLDAAGMESARIVDAVVEPDRLLARALELAGELPPERAPAGGADLVGEEEILAALAERLDVSRYQALREEAAAKKDAMEPKELAKYIDKRLAEMGRPVAPLAVEAVNVLVKEGSEADLTESAAVEALARKEAALCAALMRTRDRAIGIDSVLKAREDPLNKIAVFTQS